MPPTVMPETVPADTPQPPLTTERPGGIADRYRSLFVVGRGGMGSVEVALERGSAEFDRIVALKRLLPEGARDPRHKEMFLREARLAALLSHPNVVHAFAFGDLYGELFLAMEYVEGEPLSRVIAASKDAGGPLAPDLVAFVLADVCDGLHAAHELCDVTGHPLGVVHRDVSPQNVMIAYAGQVKVLDFGVAKLEAGGHETRTGEVKGKMAYMPPEQALGEKLDRRSDLFSVGAVLFECLTGQRMWGAGTDLDIMRRLALEDPPRLDQAMDHAPPELVALHARLVARRPAERPIDAHAVAVELRAFAARSGAPDEGAVRDRMHRLFGADAKSRRARLTEALEQAAPLHAERLKRSMESGALEGRPTLTEPVVVETPPAALPAGAHALAAPSALASPPATLGRTRRPAAVGAALVLLVAAAAGASAMIGDRPPTPASTSRAAVLSHGSAPPQTSALTPPSISTTAAAPSTSTGSATGSASAAQAARPTSHLSPARGPEAPSVHAPAPPARADIAPPAVRSPPRSPAERAKPATTPVKLPDVDPSPF